MGEAQQATTFDRCPNMEKTVPYWIHDRRFLKRPIPSIDSNHERESWRSTSSTTDKSRMTRQSLACLERRQEICPLQPLTNCPLQQNVGSLDVRETDTAYPNRRPRTLGEMQRPPVLCLRLLEGRGAKDAVYIGLCSANQGHETDPWLHCLSGHARPVQPSSWSWERIVSPLRPTKARL